MLFPSPLLAALYQPLCRSSWRAPISAAISFLLHIWLNCDTFQCCILPHGKWRTVLLSPLAYPGNQATPPLVPVICSGQYGHIPLWSIMWTW